MAGRNSITNWLLGIVGGLVGGALGYFAFIFLARQGFYAMMLPGTLLGLGCGILSGVRSNVLGILCGLLAVLLGIFTEWRFAPFIDDKSFAFFITHVNDLRSMTLIMISAGGLLAYWLGKGREGRARIRRSESVTAD